MNDLLRREIGSQDDEAGDFKVLKVKVMKKNVVMQILNRKVFEKDSRKEKCTMEKPFRAVFYVCLTK